MVYVVEILDEGVWKTASSHTQEVDRDAQYDRLVANGTDQAVLRKSTANE